MGTACTKQGSTDSPTLITVGAATGSSSRERSTGTAHQEGSSPPPPSGKQHCSPTEMATRSSPTPVRAAASESASCATSPVCPSSSRGLQDPLHSSNPKKHFFSVFDTERMDTGPPPPGQTVVFVPNLGLSRRGRRDATALREMMRPQLAAQTVEYERILGARRLAALASNRGALGSPAGGGKRGGGGGNDVDASVADDWVPAFGAVTSYSSGSTAETAAGGARGSLGSAGQLPSPAGQFGPQRLSVNSSPESSRSSIDETKSPCAIPGCVLGSPRSSKSVRANSNTKGGRRGAASSPMMGKGASTSSTGSGPLPNLQSGSSSCSAGSIGQFGPMPSEQKEQSHLCEFEPIGSPLVDDSEPDELVATRSPTRREAPTTIQANRLPVI
jgi:hypothetical protein